MKKYKGFTLVELLAIMTILGVMVILVVPQIGGSINAKKEKELEKIIDIIENAGKAYHTFNNDEYKIPIDNLIVEKFLSEKLINPITGEELNGCVKVTNDKDGVYQYTYSQCESISVPLTVVLGTGGHTTQEFESTYYDSTKIVLIDPTKDKSEFIRWEIVKGNSILNGKTLIMGNTETILYAIWQNWPTLTVELDGGTTTQSFETLYRSGTTIELTNPTKTGYTFTGWEVTGGNGAVSGSNFTMGSEDTTLTANWRINTYTITYDLSGGTSGSSAPTTGKYGETVTVSNPTRVGYTFNGWTVSGTGASMSGTNLTIGAGDITLTANWSVKVITVTFNKNDGSSSTAGQTFTYGISGNRFGYNTDGTAKWGTSGQFGAWDRTGYTLLGWSKTSTATANDYSVYSGVSDSWINSYYPSIALYAVWQINTYAISYTLNGGTAGSSAPTRGTYGSTVTVSNPTRDGYKFTGWTVSGTGATMSGTNLTIGTGNIKLTANWYPLSLIASYSCANTNSGTSTYNFTYTGNCTIINDGNNNWRVKFLTSGTFTSSISTKIDVFLVGGGGGGSGGGANKAGGGGGYTLTKKGVNITSNTSYAITIGSGGYGGTDYDAGGNGGSTSAFSYTANGGNHGYGGGGSGGSGGGGGGEGKAGGGSGGVNGGNGSAGYHYYPGGSGQGTTTREFGESSGTLYSSGGSGGPGYTSRNGASGGNNTGDGAGGSGEGGAGGTGGSGIVVIRNARG